jgi:predicted porin
MMLCGAAHAQNSVTLYGLIDEGVNFTNNAGSGSAGNAAGSRWGVRGSEDLGSGLSAIFRLEGGFNASNGEFGQEGRLFGRQAYVGLQSDRYGTLTLGRQYDPTVDLFSSITAASPVRPCTASAIRRAASRITGCSARRGNTSTAV